MSGGRMFRPPETYTHDGPVVVVPARVAAFLSRRLDLPGLRVSVRGLDAEVDAVLVAFGYAAAKWSRSRNGTNPAARAEQASVSVPWLTTGQAADLLGVGDRAVRQAISRGRLPATREGGRWVIDRDELEHYRAATAA